jgi:hypothetical protein
VAEALSLPIFTDDNEKKGQPPKARAKKVERYVNWALSGIAAVAVATGIVWLLFFE